MTQVIRLRFVTERGFVSRLIRWWGGDLGYSHVGALTDDGRELGARSSADGAMTGTPGVQLRPGDYARFTALAVIEVPCTAAEYRLFWAALSRELGMPYSGKTIIGFALGRDLADDGGWDCSALIAWALHQARILSGELQGKLRRLTPNEVYALAEQIAYDRRVAQGRPHAA